MIISIGVEFSKWKIEPRRFMCSPTIFDVQNRISLSGLMFERETLQREHDHIWMRNSRFTVNDHWVVALSKRTFQCNDFIETTIQSPDCNEPIAYVYLEIWKLQFAITSSLIAVLLMCQMIVSIKTEIYSEQWKSVELKHRAISGAAMWHRSSLNLWAHNLRLLRRDAHGLWPATSSGFIEITILVKFSLAGRLLSAWPSFLSQYPFTAWYLRTHLHACKWPLKIENKFKQV